MFLDSNLKKIYRLRLLIFFKRKAFSGNVQGARFPGHPDEPHNTFNLNLQTTTEDLRNALDRFNVVSSAIPEATVANRIPNYSEQPPVTINNIPFREETLPEKLPERTTTTYEPPTTTTRAPNFSTTPQDEEDDELDRYDGSGDFNGPSISEYDYNNYPDEYNYDDYEYGDYFDVTRTKRKSFASQRKMSQLITTTTPRTSLHRSKAKTFKSLIKSDKHSMKKLNKKYSRKAEWAKGKLGKKIKGKHHSETGNKELTWI